MEDRGDNMWCTLTNGNRILDILHFDYIPEQDTTFLLAFNVAGFVVVVKYHPRRIDDPHATFQLYGLELLRMAWQCSYGAYLFAETVKKTENRGGCTILYSFLNY
jgi:hypothetical protein